MASLWRLQNSVPIKIIDHHMATLRAVELMATTKMAWPSHTMAPATTTTTQAPTYLPPSPAGISQHYVPTTAGGNGSQGGRYSTATRANADSGVHRRASVGDDHRDDNGAGPDTRAPGRRCDGRGSEGRGQQGCAPGRSAPVSEITTTFAAARLLWWCAT